MIDQNYQNIIRNILENGTSRSDRTGAGRLSLFGLQLIHDMNQGFPLLTIKKMYTKGIITELLWFLKGDTNIKYLVDNNCNIWNGDAYKHYDLWKNKLPKLSLQEFGEKIKTDKEFASMWGELGPIYGKQWRCWSSEGDEDYDQIMDLIEGLRNNPFGSRHLVNAWNVADLAYMRLPPCHYGFQCYARELSKEERYNEWFKNNYETGFEYNQEPPDYDNEYWVPTPKYGLSLMWNQRSVDVFLGLPFNIASYGMLLQILAHETSMKPDKLIGSFGDCHLYLNHLDQAKEIITHEPYKLPRLEISPKPFESLVLDDFQLHGYNSHPKIEAPLNN